MGSGGVWWDLVGFNVVWWVLVGFGGFWWDLMWFGGVWWVLVGFGGRGGDSNGRTEQNENFFFFDFGSGYRGK